MPNASASKFKAINAYQLAWADALDSESCRLIQVRAVTRVFWYN